MSYRAKKRTETERKINLEKDVFLCVVLMYTNIPFCKCMCRGTYLDKLVKRYLLLFVAELRSALGDVKPIEERISRDHRSCG